MPPRWWSRRSGSISPPVDPPRKLARFAELWRFYQAAVVNTVFGFGLYAILVALGANRFVAQIVAHVLGVGFNYLTYSRHVFRDRERPVHRFIAAYALNYVVNLALLAGISTVVANPYLAGGLATLAASLINYAVLKFGVFTVRRGPA